jgi:hypothetical protein
VPKETDEDECVRDVVLRIAVDEEGALLAPNGQHRQEERKKKGRRKEQERKKKGRRKGKL